MSTKALWVAVSVLLPLMVIFNAVEAYTIENSCWSPVDCYAIVNANSKDVLEIAKVNTLTKEDLSLKNGTATFTDIVTLNSTSVKISGKLFDANVKWNFNPDN